MKQASLFFLLLLIATLSHAEKVEVNGIWYEIDNEKQTAVVIYDFNTRTEYPVALPESYNFYSGEVVIPETFSYNDVEYNVVAIGRHAFYKCKKLTSISIPNGVKIIGESAFGLCESLETVKLPETLENINELAFIHCKKLKTIKLPNSLNKIGRHAFEKCISLLEITIPIKIKTIEKYVFESCTSLEKVTFECELDTIDGFYGCTSLTEIAIPETVTVIGPYAFQNCTGLKEINIPNSVKEIWGEAFEKCSSLTKVTIGSGVREIGDYAFWNCLKLTDVYCLADSVPQVMFNGDERTYFPFQTGKQRTLYVPASSIEAYKARKPWCYFGKIVPIEDTNNINDVRLSDEKNTESILFDLQGRRINGTPRRGIYIRDGRKYIVQ